MLLICISWQQFNRKIIELGLKSAGYNLLKILQLRMRNEYRFQEVITFQDRNREWLKNEKS